MDDVIIKINNVSKQFILPHEKKNTIKSLFTSLFKTNRSFTKQKALKNISFEIKRGEFFGIVGRNGSGKSTLLKIIAGIYQPSSGNVTTMGKLVPFIELGVGFNPELTGRENVYLNGAILGFTREEIKENYQKIVEFSELQNYMDQKLKNYSSGMQVRLAFACATMAQADILLVDEVLAVGDADFQRKCFSYFKYLKKNHTTVVFVTHDMSAVREYCDRALLIDNSEIVSTGNADMIATEYLKLFGSYSERKLGDITNGFNRWGDGLLKISDVKIEATSSKIVASMNINNNGLNQGIIGFRLRDAAGKEVTGTNTRIENAETPEIAKNNQKRIYWELDNILSDGEYILDVAVLHEDGITVSDWWDCSATLIIKKNRRLPYPVDPGFKFYYK